MTMLGFWLRSEDYVNVLRTAAREHACPTRALREAYQLEQFHRVWRDAFENVPFYAKWKSANGLADRVASLDELESWPIVAKRDLQKDAALLVRSGRAPDDQGMTGGSTGEPLRFGKWKENAGDSTPAMWIGRGAYGVVPGDRTCLLWGHQHLYGRGWRRRMNHLERRFKDRLLNTLRLSAYDLSPQAMHAAFDAVVAFAPKFLIAFAPAMLAFCRTNREKAEAARRLGVKCVMCTAGPLSASEQEEIRSFFDAPVCMEYGAAECGVMAYSIPSGEYRTSWQTHLLQTVPDFQNAYRNIVTCLAVRYFPLIRYDIGDCLDLYPDEITRPHRFVSVIGRPSDIVRFPDGTAFFVALVGDCVKQVPKATACQTVMRGDAMVVHVLVDGQLTAADAELIVQRCRAAVPPLAGKSVVVEQRERLQMGVSGKIPPVIYEPNAGPAGR